MANKNEFLSRGLHKIRNQLAEAQASKKANENEKTEILRQSQRPQDHEAQASGTTDAAKSDDLRGEELARARRKLSGELTIVLESLPDEIGLHETRLQELNAARDNYNEMLAKLQSLEESSSDVEAQETIEKIRAEFARSSGKLSKQALPQTTAVSAHHGGSNILPELLSLSFFQLFKMGLALLLPLIITILFSAVLLGLMIRAAMGR